MKQNLTLIGIVAVLALAVVGVFFLTHPEPELPSGATVTVPPDTAADQPAEPARATATSDTTPAETMAPETQAPATQAPTTPAPATPKVAEVAPESQPAASPVAPPGAAPVQAVPPSFDVVRVERSGEAVIAGRAAPGSEVTLRAGNRVLGKVTADGRGQWVLVLETPLGPGSYELSLESRLPGGERLLSENVVVVSVPRPQVAAVESEAPATQPEAPQAAPAPEQPAPQQQAAEQPAPSQPAPSVAASEADSATQTAQDTQAAEPAAPSAQLATEAQAPEQPLSQAEPAATASKLRAEAEQALAVLMPRSGEGQIRVLQQAESVSGGLGEGTLVLETVDYDAQGRTQVGGRAEARSRLVVYLDNKPAAHAEASASGRWETTLVKPIAPGLHTLRVDQLTDDGQVAARVETPFSRAAVLAALPNESAVIVQPGNSLWRISRRIYGEGLRYSVIYQANQDQIRDPDLIYPGQIFIVPTTN